VAIGAEARLGADADVDDSVIHPGAAVGPGAVVRGTIVGPGAHVGAAAHVRGCVLGAGARVADGVELTDERVATDAEAPPA
jgi:mannose-1-phosphate guanylyltransferase